MHCLQRAHVARTSFKAINSTLLVARSMASKPTPSSSRPEDSIFAKIVSKEISAKIVLEDDNIIAFHDVKPTAPVHVLVLPKKPIAGFADLTDADPQLVGNLFIGASKVAQLLGIAGTGYRIVVNQGAHGQQSVSWLHVHVIGGRQMTWPPG